MEVDEAPTTEASASGFEKVRRAVEVVTREGFSAGQLLSQLHDILILSPLIPSMAKAKIALVLGGTDKCLTDGAEEELQLLSACARVRKAILEGDGQSS